MLSTTASSPVQRLPSDIFFIIFSLVAKDDRPRMCSCAGHGPQGLNVGYCCPKHPLCDHHNHDPLPTPNVCVYDVGWVRLGHVCRLWRNLLLQARILWANDLCTLNNSALESFLSRAGRKSLTIDFDSVYSEHMRYRESRLRRGEILLQNVHNARIVRGNCSRDGLSILSIATQPSLEMLELGSTDAIALRTSNLREAVMNGPITLYAPILLRAKCIGPSSVLPHSSSLRRLDLSCSISRCAEILAFLQATHSLKELAIEFVDSALPHDGNMQNITHSDGLQMLGCSPSLPALSELRMIGYGVAHQTICKLLSQLTTASARSLKTFEVTCTHPAVIQSSLALGALRAAAHAIEADSIYLHVRDVLGGIVAVVSLSRQELRHNPELCPSVTFRLIIAELSDLAIDDVVRTKIMSLLPLNRITHLFLDCLPMHGPSAYAQSAFCTALTQLTSVHTLNARDNDRYPNNHEYTPSQHPLVGSILNTRLSSLTALHVSYSEGMFVDWWNRLATALAIRTRVGLSFTSLCISYNWGSNVRRPEGAAISPLETFHEQTGVYHYEPDIFIANAPVHAFNLDGTNVWAKEKVESVARSLFAQVVETIEVEEASPLRPVWPPIL
ncbi:hypothetical protein PENSPDRAFT_469051 [Peniophora sp. CONT]|nr:hypothetical protein PENSPDRAFT_469051 [Peniophora sp. CONT]